MSNESTDKANPATTPPSRADGRQSARTDDLLVSGADEQDGARGFDSKADPQALQTGMEGIAHPNRQSADKEPGANKQTLPENPGQSRNK
jgi:hypothetical protein